MQNFIERKIVKIKIKKLLAISLTAVMIFSMGCSTTTTVGNMESKENEQLVETINDINIIMYRNYKESSQ